jgi:flagellar hook protein FlgE
VLDSDGKSIIVDSNGKTLDEGGDEQTIYDKLAEIWGDGTVKTSKETQDAQGQTVTVPVLANGYDVYYDSNKGTFISIGGTEAGGTGTGTGTGTGGTTTTTTYQLENASSSQVLKLRSIPSNYGSSDDGGISLLSDTDGDITSNFRNITIDLSESTNYSNGGKSSYRLEKGDSQGDGTGKKLGALIGLAVDGSGKIYGSYDNGNTELLGQIAVAQFANASGLEKVGDNCYTTTLNSGEFDGIGVEVDADGSSINSGQLEMSNVDLSSEFTNMIITQRGFQANSRVITVSDTLLEELINLKR